MSIHARIGLFILCSWFISIFPFINGLLPWITFSADSLENYNQNTLYILSRIQIQHRIVDRLNTTCRKLLLSLITSCIYTNLNDHSKWNIPINWKWKGSQLYFHIYSITCNRGFHSQPNGHANGNTKFIHAYFSFYSYGLSLKYV